MNRQQRRAQARQAAPPPPPATAQGLFDQGAEQHRAGRLEAAEALFARALEADPRHGGALYGLGLVALQGGRGERAAALLGRALEQIPAWPEAHNNLGVALQGLGRMEDAAAAHRRAAALRPGYGQAWYNLGVALRALGRPEAALQAYARAAALQPGDAQVQVDTAIVLRETGRLGEALQATGRALATAPAALSAQAHAWYVRCELKTFAPDDPELAAMEALLDRVRQAGPGRDGLGQARLHLGFALGKAWLDAGEPGRAFARLHAANAEKRAALAYDPAADLAGLAATARAFSPARMAGLAGGGCPSEAPVFVVGMPRSGTTLVEQILAAHPGVHGAGELGLLDAVLRTAPVPLLTAGGHADLPPELTREMLAPLGAAYAERLAALAPGARRVVDKLPDNLRFAGLIALMLPNARIVHCRRDPLDTCLSCYTKLFAGRLDFAYDLAELGAYHRGCEALAAHWRAVLPPGRFLEVRYEAVLADLEGQARRLAAFCGLDFDPACLDFHAVRRPLRTASAVQARQPLDPARAGRGAACAAHLGPLLDALAAAPAGFPDHACPAGAR